MKRRWTTVRQRSNAIGETLMHTAHAQSQKLPFDGHDEAIKDFDSAIKLKPDFAHAYHQRGLAKQALGRQKEADTDFAKAKEIDPDFESK